MGFSTLITTFSFANVVFAQESKGWGPECVSNLDPQVATIQGFECVFRNVVSVVTVLAGLALFIMLLMGGLKYLTSGGDPKAQEQAKNTLTYAILGMVLIVAAYLILNFISTFTGIEALKTFTIPKGP